MIRILSLGAGVQSTTLALMIAQGDLPAIDCAIFADTGAEPQVVYDHLRWLMSPNVLPFPVHIVRSGDIHDGLRKSMDGQRWVSIPAFVEGSNGRAAPLRRQCTKEYKLEPIHRKVRDLVGLKPRQSVRQMLKLKRKDAVPVLVEQLIGISRDEAIRMKPSGHPWIENKWPLVDLGIRREHCLAWLEERGYPRPPKSSCYFCPYHNDAMWRDIRDNQPNEWRKAIAVDEMIAGGAKTTETRAGTKPLFLHRSLKRLRDVDLSNKAKHSEPDLFGNECEGMCGV